MRTSLVFSAAIAALGIVSAAAWQSAQHPSWNLDGIFYAVLIQPSATSLAERHRVAYASTAALAPTPERTALESGSSYRRALRDDLNVFALQLPFYTNKPLYLWAGRLALASGAATAHAPYVVSAISYVLTGIGLFVLGLLLGARPIWMSLAAALAMLSPPLRALAELATPDALSTMLLLAGAIVVLRTPAWAVLPLLAATATRPDVGILSLGILFACWRFEPTPRRALQLGMLGASICAVAVLVPIVTDSHGWVPLMRHTFVHRCLEPADFVQGISWLDYPKALIKGLRGHDVSRIARFEPFLLLSVICFWVYRKRERTAPERMALHLLSAIWLATVARFLAFPAFSDRHFAPAHVFSVALGCALLTHLYDARVRATCRARTESRA